MRTIFLLTAIFGLICWFTRKEDASKSLPGQLKSNGIFKALPPDPFYNDDEFDDYIEDRIDDPWF